MEKRRVKKTTVFVSGKFNVLHPGHIRLFKFASELAEKVIVGLRSDEPESPFMLPYQDREQALHCVNLVDEIIEVKELHETLESLQPDIVLKGSEFKDKFNEEENIIDRWNGELVFSSGESQFNSDRYFDRNGVSNEVYIPKSYKDFVKRHNISVGRIKHSLASMSELNIAVIGDSILDEYISCDPVGLSREDPTIVVTPTERKLFIGGAAIVSLHTASFGANVDFYTLSGLDDEADFLRQQLDTNRVRSFIYQDKSRPTTVKRRFRALDKTLLRVNEFRSHAMERRLQSKFFNDFRKNVANYDLVIFSDFSYGMLGVEAVFALQKICRENGVQMVADSQTSSQRGDLSKFKDLKLTAPTEIEARLAVDNMNNDIGLAVVIEDLARQLNTNNVVITLGADGALILDYNDQNTPRVDTLPALNKRPVDVSGAGDLLMISTALSLKTGCDLWHSSLVGMIASAIHISEVGNTPIALKRINQYLEKL